MSDRIFVSDRRTDYLNLYIRFVTFSPFFMVTLSHLLHAFQRPIAPKNLRVKFITHKPDPKNLRVNCRVHTSHCDAQWVPARYPSSITRKKKMTIGVLENKMPALLHGHYIFRNARRAFCFFEMPIATLHF